jgi:hypothetical protein
MTGNDLLLLAILAIGAGWINWNVIKRDLFHHQSSTPASNPKKKSAPSSSVQKEILEEHLS